MNVITVFGLGIQISIVLTVLSLGMRATLNDIVYWFRRPGQMIRALLSIYVIMPTFAILVVNIFELNALIKVVLVALSVSPIPPMFPKKAFKSEGKASFTFGLLAAVALLSIIMIPLAFAVFGAVIPRDTYFSESLIINTLLTSLLLPLAIGMNLRHFAPSFSERYAEMIAKISGIMLIVSVLPILIAMLPKIWSLIDINTVWVLIVFALVSVAAGYLLGGPEPKDRTVLALATASRHPGIAIALAGANVAETPKIMIAAAVILYLIITAIVVAPVLLWLSSDEAAEKAIPGKAAFPRRDSQQGR